MSDESSAPPQFYSNVVEFTVGPYDLIVDYGFKSPEHSRKGSPDWDKTVRVVMSLGHAKSMLPILAKLIADYESKVGTIVAPGFDELSKE